MILLYPEAFLFPRMFPKTLGHAPVGAMPMEMLLKPWSGQKGGMGLATLVEHIRVRTLNHRSLTSMNANYRSFLFSALMNLQLNYHPLRILMKRGPEALGATKDNSVTAVNLDKTADFLLEDVGMQRRAEELAAMMRDFGMWKYFVTFTCNLKSTPTVSHLMEWMEYVYGPENRERAYTSHLPLITRVW
jgi:hypothetical protein